jgi:RimJ/RimL family protein N-acetyltransferase
MSSTETVRTPRLTLVPLNAAHAAEMVGVLSDPALYTFTGGDPPEPSALEEQYRFQSAGCPRDDEVWHNWIVHLDGAAIGLVQATVIGEIADLAWVVGTPWQGSGYATEAAAGMRDWLTGQGVRGFSAHIHSDHSASQAVATRLGLLPTDLRDDEGETIWK